MQTSDITKQEKNIQVSLMRLLKGLLPILMLAAVIGCTKVKNTDIGADLLPDIDNVNTFDTTLSVSVENFYTPDSLLPKMTRTYSGAIGEFVLGHLANDPMFGSTTASMYYELKPSEYPFTYQASRDSLYIDSVVLSLKWKYTFGDTNGVQTIDVYRVNEFIRPDSSYPITASASYDELMSSITFSPSILDDSVNLRTYKTKDILRIPLKKSFGKVLLSWDTISLKSPLKNDSLFREYYKGFALVPQKLNSANSLMTFDMDDTTTNLRLYYQYVKDGKRDTVYKTFTFNNLKLGGAINQITRKYEGSESSSYITKKQKDSLVYIQTAPGTYANIKLPAIDAFKKKKGNVIIHLAELSMQEVVTPARRSEIFTPPPFLYLEAYDSANNYYIPFVSDGFNAGTFDPPTFGGMKKLTVDPLGNIVSRYEMNITRYLQGIITRNSPNLAFRLTAPYNVYYKDLNVSFNLNHLCRGGVTLGGGSHPTQRMKLRVVYSKL